MQLTLAPPSTAVAVIVELPTFFAVTMPSEDTSATDVSLDDQVTLFMDALTGETVAISRSESPLVSDKEDLFRETDST